MGCDERTEREGRCLDEAAEARHDERGAGLVEYALLVALIVLVCIAAVQLLGGTTQGIYSSAVSGLG